MPTVTDWRAAFKDLATPIVNIRRAGDAGTRRRAHGGNRSLGQERHLQGYRQGLDQNQKNAMQTYLSNQENAKAFGEMAKEVFMMGHNTEHSERSPTRSAIRPS